MKGGAFTFRNDRSFQFALIGSVLADPKNESLRTDFRPRFTRRWCGGLFSVNQCCFGVFRKDDTVEILKVRPGLSGIGAIYFRDEENLLHKAQGDMIGFCDDVISPYKGRLEAWWVKNRSLKNYFLLIVLTVWVIVFPKSTLLVTLLKDLPPPPQEL